MKPLVGVSKTNTITNYRITQVLFRSGLVMSVSTSANGQKIRYTTERYVLRATRPIYYRSLTAIYILYNSCQEKSRGGYIQDERERVI